MALWPGALYEAVLEAGRWLAGSQHSRLRQLAALRELDERLLADVGISREEARRRRRLETVRAGRARAHPSPGRQEEAFVAPAGPGR